MSPVRVEIDPLWGELNDDLLRVVDLIPDDKINWSPKPELWNFRGILLHLISARDVTLGSVLGDGADAPNVYETTRSRAEMQRELARTSKRLDAFFSAPERLDAVYETDVTRRDVIRSSGHYIVIRLLEHDIHHRADLLHYLALLEIDTQQTGINL